MPSVVYVQYMDIFHLSIMLPGCRLELICDQGIRFCFCCRKGWASRLFDGGISDFTVEAAKSFVCFRPALVNLKSITESTSWQAEAESTAVGCSQHSRWATIRFTLTQTARGF